MAGSPAACSATTNTDDPEAPAFAGSVRSRELTRGSFELDVDEGRIDALSLRCDLRVESLPYSADAVWTVPETWGSCLLFVTGDAGTSFTVLEYLD